MKRGMIYLGYKTDGVTLVREIFRHPETPTFSTHGDRFNAVVGPFHTVRGARFMRDYGRGNPHCRCVADAEELGKLHATWARDELVGVMNYTITLCHDGRCAVRFFNHNKKVRIPGTNQYVPDNEPVHFARYAEAKRFADDYLLCW